MSAGTLYDTGAPTLEVRVDTNDRLREREPRDSGDDTLAEDHPIASARIPGYGTE